MTTPPRPTAKASPNVSAFARPWTVPHERADPLHELITAGHEPSTRRLWDVLVRLEDAASVGEANSAYPHRMLPTWTTQSAAQQVGSAVQAHGRTLGPRDAVQVAADRCVAPAG
ncbi:hypothetical protein GCM10009527_076500 [Actinomadura nitritigenes]